MIDPYKLNPTPALVNRVAIVHEREFSYDKQNYSTVRRLVEAYRSNRSYSNIRIKVDVVNGILNTVIGDTFGVARQIYERVHGIDQRLAAGDLLLVEELALYQTVAGEWRRNYSFATKYCHAHEPELFPIYDQYVEKSLLGYQRAPDFDFFTKRELIQYVSFWSVVMAFRQVYGLQRTPAARLDRFLWAVGKHGADAHLQRVFREGWETR